MNANVKFAICVNPYNGFVNVIGLCVGQKLI